MLGIKEQGDDTIAGGQYLIAAGQDGQAVSCEFFGKDGIGNLGKFNGFPGNGSNNAKGGCSCIHNKMRPDCSTAHIHLPFEFI